MRVQLVDNNKKHTIDYGLRFIPSPPPFRGGDFEWYPKYIYRFKSLFSCEPEPRKWNTVSDNFYAAYMDCGFIDESINCIVGWEPSKMIN